MIPHAGLAAHSAGSGELTEEHRMRFDNVRARLGALPDVLPEPPDVLIPFLLGPADRSGERLAVDVDDRPALAGAIRRSATGRRVRGGDGTAWNPGCSPARPVPLDQRIPWPARPRRHAAALVLLFPDPEGEARVVLIERPRGDLRHAGEIALPGGEIEPGDRSAVEAAIREAGEEVGLDPVQAGVSIVGPLADVEIRVSGFELLPILALAARAPDLRADPREVARILEVPLRHFVAGSPVEVVEEVRAGWLVRYGVFPADGLRVWGATARVLGQLGALLAG